MDDMDRAQEREQLARTAAISQAARELPAGEPGECDYCGEQRLRLVHGACARCRDEYGLDRPGKVTK